LKQPCCTAWLAKHDALRFRAHDEESLLEIFQHYHDDFDDCIPISPETHERLHKIVHSNENRLYTQAERTGCKLYSQQSTIQIRSELL